MSETVFQQAIEHFGSQVKAAAALGLKQSTISEALARGKPSVAMAMAIEAATDGKFTFEKLRPDAAHKLRALRKRRAA